ncbi:TetR/AcrR family transcriptional regulator C-terminal domain-containing protein [Sphingomonas baiyangensis]|uniref:TetR family transcriptional regulator n=1 Tax=Sphingomonas baiyangensis TaxID=2572576 RepID=A0A4U1L237_9SPHN|nr:TetR/AcrR family transcriptional regulator C-terminal domain-containing protein [Sphingomonas baiyangensis]TKD50662.1 TetR family transcriptional regulator [Sphingomonas baiyangensis]
MATRPAPALDRERLTTAAFAELAEAGIDKLSMRRVAARLDVQAPALYWHVAGKDELLGLMAAEIYSSAEAVAAADWQGWLTGFGRGLRASLAGHRDGARLCAAARPKAGADAARNAERIAAPLVALGLDRDTALSRRASVTSFTLGWAIFEANGPMHDFLGQMLDFDASFEAGLAALVQGFAVPR